MKPLITILKILGTLILSVVIIPLMFCTMTLYSVSHFVSSEYLTDVIQATILSASMTNSDNAKSANNTVGSVTALSNTTYNANNTDSHPNTIEITEGIKIDVAAGIIYIGETGSIDISSTGIAEVPGLTDIEPTEENITNILANTEIISPILEYLGNSLMDYINGEELPDITVEQCEKLTSAVLDGIENEFDIAIPDDVKNNVTEEIVKNNSEISDVLRNQIPTVEEIKEEYCLKNDINPEYFDAIFTAVTTIISMLFNNTLFYLFLGAVIFVAVLMLLINLRNLNGLLVVGILGIINGLIFASVGILGNAIAPDIVMGNELSSEWLNIAANFFNTVKMTGLVAVIISVALIVIKIVVGNILLNKIRHNTTGNENAIM